MTLLPWDRCPLCGEAVSRTCPDCYTIHTRPDCRGHKHRAHPFPERDVASQRHGR